MSILFFVQSQLSDLISHCDSWLYFAKEYCLTPHYVTSATLVTGADGEQQSELCQVRVDLCHQRTTKDATLSTLHCCPMNFLSTYNHV